MSIIIFFKVWRLPLAPCNGEYTNGLTLSYATKEKKQKSGKFEIGKTRSVRYNFVLIHSHEAGQEEGERSRCREGAVR